MLFSCVFANQNLRLWSAFPRRCHPSVRPEVLFLQTFRHLDLPTFRRLPFRHRDEKRVTCRDFRPFFSYACTLFHFPYPSTPLFAILTKTTGVYPNNSPLPSEKQPLCFYALTNCSPRNSFLLHSCITWGVYGVPLPSNRSSSATGEQRSRPGQDVPTLKTFHAHWSGLPVPILSGSRLGSLFPCFHQSPVTLYFITSRFPKGIIFPQHGRRC